MRVAVHREEVARSAMADSVDWVEEIPSAGYDWPGTTGHASGAIRLLYSARTASHVPLGNPSNGRRVAEQRTRISKLFTQMFIPHPGLSSEVAIV